MKTYRIWSKDGSVHEEVKGTKLDWATDAGLILIRNQTEVVAAIPITNAAFVAEKEG